jgi:hypothetical protein
MGLWGYGAMGLSLASQHIVAGRFKLEKEILTLLLNFHTLGVNVQLKTHRAVI